jgi:NitT/TauT family transport system permease protein
VQSHAEALPAGDDGPPAAIVAPSAAFALVALGVVCLGALLAHLYGPDRQLLPLTWMDRLPAWQHPYPAVLEGLLLSALLLAGFQRNARTRAWTIHAAPLLTGAVAALALWDAVTQKFNWMQLPYFPGPDLVLGAIIEDRGILLDSAAHSLALLFCGYFVGVLTGIGAGILIGWFPRVRYWGMPALKIIGPLPATALIPLVMSFSKNSFLPAVSLIAYAVWFPVTMLTSSGIASVRTSYLDVARTLGAERRFLIWHVALPSAMPHIFIGLFMGLASSFLTLIVAETVGVQAGLGWYINWRRGAGMEYANVYGALLLMSLFFSALMTLLFAARDRLLKWQKGTIRW